jgi:YfiH family protein
MNQHPPTKQASTLGSWEVLKDRTTSIELGRIWHWNQYRVLFGNQNLTEKILLEHFPQVELLKVKQIHSAKVVLASHEIIEADAHFSASSQVALQIKTADCMPVFALDSKTHIIMAIHSGWRGVVGKIVELAIDEMIKRGSKPRDVQVIIGPHIRKQSFEVDQPVWVELMDAIPVELHHEASRYYEKIPGEKYKVDLEGIIKTQLRNKGVAEQQIESLLADTLTDLTWHSYRRDKEKSGRNISFILRD